VPTNREDNVLTAEREGADVGGELLETNETMRITVNSDAVRTLGGMPPFHGTQDAEDASASRVRGIDNEAADWRGAQEAFILVKRGSDTAQTPVWHEGGAEGGRVVAAFTTRENAILYEQTADWLEQYTERRLALAELGPWLRGVRGRGATFVAVDPDRLGQVRGELQPALALDDLMGRSEGELSVTLQEAGKR